MMKSILHTSLLTFLMVLFSCSAEKDSTNADSFGNPDQRLTDGGGALKENVSIRFSESENADSSTSFQTCTHKVAFAFGDLDDPTGIVIERFPLAKPQLIELNSKSVAQSLGEQFTISFHREDLLSVTLQVANVCGTGFSMHVINSVVEMNSVAQSNLRFRVDKQPFSDSTIILNTDQILASLAYTESPLRSLFQVFGLQWD